MLLCLLQVIAIQRYLRDPKHESQTGGHAGEALDMIQITVADNNHKVKVLLHSDLNKLVQRQAVSIILRILHRLEKCFLTPVTLNTVFLLYITLLPNFHPVNQQHSS